MTQQDIFPTVATTRCVVGGWSRRRFLQLESYIFSCTPELFKRLKPRFEFAEIKSEAMDRINHHNNNNNNTKYQLANEDLQPLSFDKWNKDYIHQNKSNIIFVDKCEIDLLLKKAFDPNNKGWYRLYMSKKDLLKIVNAEDIDDIDQKEIESIYDSDETQFDIMNEIITNPMKINLYNVLDPWYEQIKKKESILKLNEHIIQECKNELCNIAMEMHELLQSRLNNNNTDDIKDNDNNSSNKPQIPSTNKLQSKHKDYIPSNDTEDDDDPDIDLIPPSNAVDGDGYPDVD